MTGTESAPTRPAVPATERRHGRRAVLRWTAPLIAAALFGWRHLRRYLAGLSVGGMAMALLFFCFSMTPSLLPRPWYLQGVASGMCTVTGYAVGVLIGWLLRKIGFRPLDKPHHRRLVHRVLLVSAAVTIPLFGLLGALWQYQVRQITHADQDDANYYAVVLLIVFALARITLSVARMIRWATRRVGRFGARWVPLPVAKLIAAGAVGFLIVTVFTDALVPAVLSVANASFSLTDHGTEPGIHRPTDAHRSGSPSSLVEWTDLGREGRTFVDSGPRAADIHAFSGAPALDPIRVYAGVHSAPTLAAEADLVVDELNRTGAFDRAVLVVATTTGRGWVNEVAAAAVEYLWGGDTAIAAMQYSYLPSPVAFITDRSTPPEAGTVLFDAIHREWAKRAPGHRPRLIVMGESLGSYGSQGAFASLADLQQQADGAVWAGTPHFTELWQELTAGRDPGAPQQVPVIDHCAVVCFMAQASDLPRGAHPSVVYLQHTNDPVVWWTPSLLLNRPDWLVEPALAGRTDAMTWIPFVTFWQVTTDMVFSTDMPPGFGHDYTVDYVDAFAAVVPPPGWSTADTARLRARLSGLPTGE